jgi:glycerol uptake facilitator-like aquaporin
MVHDLYVLVFLYMARIMFAPMTGAYFNTAVTIGVFINRNSNNKISPKRLLFYIMAQLMGAAIAVTISKVVYDASVAPFDPRTDYSSN